MRRVRIFRLSVLLFGKYRHIVLGKQHALNALCACGALGTNDEHPCYAEHCIQYDGEIAQKRKYCTRFGQAGVHPARAHDHDQCQTDVQHDGSCRVGYRHDNACLLVFVGKAGIYIIKAFPLMLALAERLYNPDAGRILLHGAYELIEYLLAMGIYGYAVLGHKIDHHRDYREHCNQHQCEHGVEGQCDNYSPYEQKRSAYADALNSHEHIVDIVAVGSKP